MTTQTSAPIGSTGQSLEGVAVSTAAGANLFRESVVLADPNDPIGYAQVVSTQPASSATPYGAVMYLAGNPNISTTVNVTATALVTNTISTQVISSIPYFVAQSSAPWTMNGGVTISSVPTVSTQIVSSLPILVAQSTSPWTVGGTVSSQIVSSLPILVSQSTSPWTVGGTVSSQIVSSLPILVAQSTSPWTIGGTVSSQITSSIPLIVALTSTATAVISTWPLNTTQVNIVSSIPLFVAQSSAPWRETLDGGNLVSTAGGLTATTLVLANTLNTTVIKANQGKLYGVSLTSISSSNCFVRFYAASAAANVIASTGVPLYTLGVFASTIAKTDRQTEDWVSGINFSTGITIIAQQQIFTATTPVAPTASTCLLTVQYF